MSINKVYIDGFELTATEAIIYNAVKQSPECDYVKLIELTKIAYSNITRIVGDLIALGALKRTKQGRKIFLKVQVEDGRSS